MGERIFSYQTLVGQTLRKMREEAGISLNVFAEKMGVGKAAWSKTENGVSALTAMQMGKAEKILGLPHGAVMQRASRVADHLEKEQGIKIDMDRRDQEIKTAEQSSGLGAALLIGAAAAAFIAAVWSQSGSAGDEDE